VGGKGVPPEQVHLLTGVSASPEFLKRLTFICYNHNENIVAIDTVRVRPRVGRRVRLGDRVPAADAAGLCR